MSSAVEVSAIIPVSKRYDRQGTLVEKYLASLQSLGRSFELICVLDGDCGEFENHVLALSETERSLKVIRLAKTFGEATAITAGYEYASGETIVTLPAYYQIEPGEIDKLIDKLDDCDLAIAVRWPRVTSSRFENWRREAFHWLVAKVGHEKFTDLGCGARAMRRIVLQEIPLYAEQHRLLPLLALRRGFHVREVKVRQSAEDRFEGRYGARTYLRQMLDILGIVFLVRFTKKPLRFFGMIGSVMFLLGAIFLVYVIIDRVFFGVGLADRPALLLSSLLVVLGLQLFALGLLGELIIFTHAQDLKEYTIEKIVN